MVEKLGKIIPLIGLTLLILVNSGCLSGGGSGGSTAQYSQPQEQTYKPKPSLKILNYGSEGHFVYVKNSGDGDAYNCVLLFEASPYGKRDFVVFDSEAYGNIPAGKSTAGGVAPELNKLGRGTWEVGPRIKCDNYETTGNFYVVTLR